VSRTAALIALILVPCAAACDKVALLAPNESTITLSVNTTTLPSNGTAEVLATVIEQAGTPVHNGTVVTFTTNVGVIEPREARTEGGIARATFRANGQSGTATISAFSGAARVDEPVEIRVGAAAAETVSLRTEPASVPQTGGTVQIIADVVDPSGNPLPGVQVTFSSTAGSLQSTTATTDQSGEARTSLTTNRETTVRARVSNKEAQTTIGVVNLPTIQMTASNPSPAVGTPVQFTITPGANTGGNPIREIIFDPGDGTPARSVGTSTTTVSHTYTSSGSFTARATIADSAGLRNETSLTVSVSRPVINVTISANPTEPAVGQLVTFTATATTPSGGPPITSIEVTFCDGGRITTQSGQSFTRSFANPGTCIVTARAVDAAGSTGTGQTSVIVRPRAALEINVDANSADPNFTVTCLPPTAYPKTCTATPAGFGSFGAANARIQFTANVTASANDPVISYVWDFDDGSRETTNTRSTDHTFARFRSYTVTVTATTASGQVGNGRVTVAVQ
jgi:adhesin/invasin